MHLKVLPGFAKQTQEHVDDIKRYLRDVIEVEISHINKPEILLGDSRIHAAASALVSDCDDDTYIRATAQLSGDHLHQDYLRVVAKRVGKALEDPPGDMRYQVILPGRDPERSRAENLRVRAFSEVEGARDRMDIRYTDSEWPFEVIVGKNSFILAFPGPPNTETNHFGIKVTDARMVDRAMHWYDTQLWMKASERPYESRR